MDPSEVAALTSLELAKVYEKAGRLKLAEDAYAKAFGSRDEWVREQAKEGLERVLSRQASRRAILLSWFSELLGPLLRILVQAIIIVLLLPFLPPLVFFLRKAYAIIGKKSGRNKLDIAVLDSTQQKLGASFADVLRLSRERMDYYIRHRNSIISGNLPALTTGYAGPLVPAPIPPEDSGLVQLIESSFQGQVGKIAGYFAQWLNHPEFLIRATAKSTGQAVNMIVLLEHWNEVMWTWDMVSSVQGFLEAERDLAFEIMKQLREYSNHENAA